MKLLKAHSGNEKASFAPLGEKKSSIKGVRLISD